MRTPHPCQHGSKAAMMMMMMMMMSARLLILVQSGTVWYFGTTVGRAPPKLQSSDVGRFPLVGYRANVPREPALSLPQPADEP